MPATIDEALEILEDTGPEFGGGLSNHGPMAAEALVVLGRDSAVVPWVEGYKRLLCEHPDARDPISPEAWREALGDGRRIGDWVVFFDTKLAQAPWRNVLEEWTARLAPGLIAAATHGVIRAAHAARSLAAEETPLRLHELAEGLGYWATRYQRLPEAPSPNNERLPPSQAVRRIQPIPPDEQQAVGLISAGLATLDGYPAFAPVIDWVDTSIDASSFLSDLTETFANVYLANSQRNRLIVFIHAVTSPSAVRLLARHLSDETVASALRYAWQAGAALYAAFGSTTRPEAVTAPDWSRDELIDRAVATGDEHAIKFTEACLREHDLNPAPVYLAAAADAVARMSR